MMLSLLLGAAFAISADSTKRPAPSDTEHVAVLELGAAAERSTAGGPTSWGATIAGEVTPIEDWLELELGVTALHSAQANELSVDLLFKKPWQLSRTMEFMAGVGPQLSRESAGGAHTTRISTEAVLDFMFWPRQNVGWYLEPSYATTGIRGERTVGLTGGFIIGFP